MKEKEMKTHTKKQLRCIESEPKKQFYIWTATKTALIWGVKTLLKTLLLRPATWKWAMVKLPETIDRLDLFVKDAVAFVIDLFT